MIYLLDFILSVPAFGSEKNLSTEAYAGVAESILTYAKTSGRAYHMLSELCLKIGPRLSGSPQANKAIIWSRQKMLDYGMENVRLQEITVPVWQRGDVAESFVTGLKGLPDIPISVTALGGSIPTPEDGIRGEIIEVASLDDIAKLGEKAVGKIIFYNQRMDARHRYGKLVRMRNFGASQAAKLGAKGVIVRSLTKKMNNVPHTGVVIYSKSAKKIPAVAVSTMDAELISRLKETHETVSVRIVLNCRTLPDGPSANVIGEIKGLTKPDEIVLLGAHLDSWDLGHGAHDNAAGCAHVLEALRLIKALGLRPARTIRGVLFMNEENGLRGASEYAESVKKSGQKHIVAIESDRGGFRPAGFTVNGENYEIERLSGWATIFKKIGANKFYKGSGGADIEKLKKIGVTTVGLATFGSTYFDYHHSADDVFNTVNGEELELGAAAMALLAYLVSMGGM